MLVYALTIVKPADRPKLERLYLEYRSVMFCAANEILHNEHEAEDAVQQAFVKIAENLDKVPDELSNKTKAFVVTIAENTAIDRYRKLKRHGDCELCEEACGIEANSADELVSCILKLPARYRQFILLKYYHGYSTREIAKLLGMSSAAASKTAQRAKQRLEQLCKEAGLL
ncbi:MAG: RNA polymerase sigma factor [Christensenellales bacterium]